MKRRSFLQALFAGAASIHLMLAQPAFSEIEPELPEFDVPHGCPECGCLSATVRGEPVRPGLDAISLTYTCDECGHNLNEILTRGMMFDGEDAYVTCGVGFETLSFPGERTAPLETFE